MVEAIYSVLLGIRPYSHSLSGKHFHRSVPRFITCLVCESNCERSCVKLLPVFIDIWTQDKGNVSCWDPSQVKVCTLLFIGHSINHKLWSNINLSNLFCWCKHVLWIAWWFTASQHFKYSCSYSPSVYIAHWINIVTSYCKLLSHPRL